MNRSHDLAPYRHRLGRDMSAVLVDLDILDAMIRDWQRVQNLVSRETLDTIWDRHILDSLQILPLLPVSTSELKICDIGSGGGFPALPLAIALKGTGVHMHLIESNARKCAFLSAVARRLDLKLTVHKGRIEAISPDEVGNIDIFTSRALAPMALLFSYLHRLWGANARAILHKGREFREELAQVDSDWDYCVVEHQSVTDPHGVLLDISRLTHRST